MDGYQVEPRRQAYYLEADQCSLGGNHFVQRWRPKFSLHQLLVFVTLAAFATAWRAALWDLLTKSIVPIVLVLFGGVVLLHYTVAGIRAGLARWGCISCWRTGLLWPLGILAGRWRVAYQLACRGVEAIDAGDQPRAVELLSASIRLAPAEATYWVNRGIAWYRREDFDAAIADLTHAIQLAPADKHARAYRGYAYLAVGQPQLALDDLSLYPCENGDDALVAYYRGIAREEVFAWERAAEDFRLAYRLDETLHAAAIMLARLQACCPHALVRDGVKAIANAERICALEGWNNWHSLSILAAAYAETGDFANAIEYAQQAHDLAPDEEQPERRRRLEQYERRECYRLPEWATEAECQAF